MCYLSINYYCFNGEIQLIRIEIGPFGTWNCYFCYRIFTYGYTYLYGAETDFVLADNGAIICHLHYCFNIFCIDISEICRF